MLHIRINQMKKTSDPENYHLPTMARRCPNDAEQAKAHRSSPHKKFQQLATKFRRFYIKRQSRNQILNPKCLFLEKSSILKLMQLLMPNSTELLIILLRAAVNKKTQAKKHSEIRSVKYNRSRRLYGAHDTDLPSVTLPT